MKTLLAIIVLLNGKPIEFKDAKPFVHGKVLMVPLREVTQEMKTTTSFKRKSVVVHFQRWDTKRKLVMQLGSRTAFTSRSYSRYELLRARIKPQKPTFLWLDAAPQLKNGRIFVPLRFAQSLGYKVDWDKAERAASIVKTLAPRPKPEKKPTDSSNRPVAATPIEVTLTTDKQNYRTGETVTFTLTARNTMNKTQILNFNSGQSFDIIVTPAKGSTPIWRWSHDKAFTDALREQTLEPQETITFSATWNQTDEAGESVPRGEYSVKAKITADVGTEANSVRIELSE